MRQTVAQLKKSGFKIGEAQDAVSCTSVELGKAFWYYNAVNVRDLSDVVRLVGNMKQASANGEGYRLIVAGEYRDNQEFPFALFDEDSYRDIKASFDAVMQAQDAVDQAVAELNQRKKALEKMVFSI